ncbi:MAG TPA: enolase C-terminal domain-like protein [Tepidisphaeraceae bacterium]|nr:enolase C-terminal domain-like protein [Tepidisphaeraceae bacterium]
MKIDQLDVSTYRVPTDGPESDGTLKWDHTDLVMVQLHAGNLMGTGWTYASAATASFVNAVLRDVVVGQPLTAIEMIWQKMCHQLRNAGVPGAGMMAVAAVDIALWDLKARHLQLPLVDLFSAAQDAVAIYGSGGFTSYSEKKLAEQLGGWASEGIGRVKMKVGRDPAADPMRVSAARRAIGPGVELFVDANGAYSRKQALALAAQFAAESNVSWFEEPRPSDDLQGLRLLRDRAPAGMDIAAGEYGDTPGYFRRMLEAGAVDCLQADATRCGGYTGFLKVAAICEASQVPLSAHCAPQLHAHVGCAVSGLRHVEYFHDHNRIDRMLFDGALDPVKGTLRPDRNRLGHGMTFKTADAKKYLIS